MPAEHNDQEPTGLVPPMKVMRRRLGGIYRADTISGPTRRYILVVGLLVVLASLPTLAAITAGPDALDTNAEPAAPPFLPTPSKGPVIVPSPTPSPSAPSSPPVAPAPHHTRPPLGAGSAPAQPSGGTRSDSHGPSSDAPRESSRGGPESSGGPARPVPVPEPTRPDRPASPGSGPGAPTEPGVPGQPGKPGNPGKPGHPGKPDHPEKPGTGWCSERRHCRPNPGRPQPIECHDRPDPGGRGRDDGDGRDRHRGRDDGDGRDRHRGREHGDGRGRDDGYGRDRDADRRGHRNIDVPTTVTTATSTAATCRSATTADSHLLAAR